MEQTVTKEKNFQPHNFWKKVKDNKGSIVRYGAFLFIIILFAILTNGKIFQERSIKAILRSALPLIVIGCGATMIYACGESDLACGGVTGFCAIFGIIVYNATGTLPFGFRVALVFLTTISIGILFYYIIWFVCAKFKLNSMFASLAIMFILRGIGGAIVEKSFDKTTNSFKIAMLDTKNFLQIFYSKSTVPMIMAIIVVLLTSTLLGYTVIGKRQRSIADNELSSKQSGTKVVKTKLIFYLLAGACIGIGAVLYMGINPSPGAGDLSAYGKEYMMEVLIAIILGGMPVSGGSKSKISAVVIGAFTLKILYVGLTLYIPMSPLAKIDGLSVAVAYQFIEGIIFLLLVEMIIRQPKHIKALPI